MSRSLDSTTNRIFIACAAEITKRMNGTVCAQCIKPTPSIQEERKWQAESNIGQQAGILFCRNKACDRLPIGNEN